jgi:flagellar FliL protein
MLALGALALVVVSAGIPTAYFVFAAKKAPVTEELASDSAGESESGLVAEGADDEEQLSDDEERLGAILPLETFLINLDGGSYLRTQVQLEFVGAVVPTPFVRNQVVVRDGLIALMSRKKAEELGSSKGRENLKTEIRELINEVLKREEIKRVFFTQFVIQ